MFESLRVEPVCVGVCLRMWMSVCASVCVVCLSPVGPRPLNPETVDAAAHRVLWSQWTEAPRDDGAHLELLTFKGGLQQMLEVLTD